MIRAMEVTPKWLRHVIRWTSPAWYLFLVYCVLALLYMLLYLAFTDE